jgi:beta-N-acetylhexosaminidase
MNKSNPALFGKHFIVEPSGFELTADESRQFERLQPQGILLRTRNFRANDHYWSWVQLHRRLLEQVRSVLKHKHLIIAIDHEGGRVVRPPEPITRFPYAAFWANASEQVGEAMATELKSLGVNVNFAPVADIHTNPKNPVISQRAFASTKEEVASAAVNLAHALRDNGITPCAKHFPGHGGTITDSHWGTPSLDADLDALRMRELFPFQALIDDGIGMIMTAHILFPNIDPDNVATLSKPILHDLLRDEMGFNGVIIADALGMGATRGKLANRETIARAVNAGLDLFLCAGDSITIEDALAMAELMEDALKSGEISQNTLSDSDQRIDKLVHDLPQYPVTELDTATLEKHHALAAALQKQTPWTNFTLSLPGFE